LFELIEFDPFGIGGTHMDTCCELQRQLAEKFATAARLYAEAVVVLTRHPTKSEPDYNRLLKATGKAQNRSEAAAVAWNTSHYISAARRKVSMATAGKSSTQRLVDISSKSPFCLSHVAK
jgi:hypothetical protein